MAGNTEENEQFRDIGIRQGPGTGVSPSEIWAQKVAQIMDLLGGSADAPQSLGPAMRTTYNPGNLRGPIHLTKHQQDETKWAFWANKINDLMQGGQR